jgi:hypothetical protein
MYFLGVKVVFISQRGNSINIKVICLTMTIITSVQNKVDEVKFIIIPTHNKVVRGVYWNQLVRPAVRTNPEVLV